MLKTQLYLLNTLKPQNREDSDIQLFTLQSKLDHQSSKIKL